MPVRQSVLLCVQTYDVWLTRLAGRNSYVQAGLDSTAVLGLSGSPFESPLQLLWLLLPFPVKVPTSNGAKVRSSKAKRAWWYGSHASGIRLFASDGSVLDEGEVDAELIKAAKAL